MLQIHPVVDEGLGNSAYVVELGDGRALVMDPARDPTPYLELVRRRTSSRYGVGSRAGSMTSARPSPSSTT